MLAIHPLSFSAATLRREDFSRKGVAIGRDLTMMGDRTPETVSKKNIKASQPAYVRCPFPHGFGGPTKRRRVFVWEDSTCPHRRISRSTPPPPLTVAKMAALTEIKPAQIRRHIKSGAPVDAKGRITLAAYCAWLNAQLVGKQ